MKTHANSDTSDGKKIKDVRMEQLNLKPGKPGAVVDNDR